MGKAKYPITPAVRALRAAGLEWRPHLYPWEPKGGTAASSAALGVDEHQVIKTLIMEDDQRTPMVVLMHGDRQVSTRNLARQLKKKSVSPCEPKVADRHSGYQVGGTSPLGLRKAMPIYAQASIFELELIWINGGKRGFLVELAPRPLLELLGAQSVDAEA